LVPKDVAGCSAMLLWTCVTPVTRLATLPAASFSAWVETKNGVTQLAGFVTSQGMKDKAGKVAAGVDGVTRVDNVLLVKPK
jgi:hypothetical protein